MKFCPDCGFERPIEEFYRVKARNYAGGYRISAFCREHTIKRNAATRAKSPPGSATREAARRASRKWAKEHPEANRAAQARWRAANPEKVRARHRAWQLANPEKNRAKALRYYHRHKKIQTQIIETE